jgi:metal-responsive CopG/Arc/MetJ family transcriptional regulator
VKAETDRFSVSLPADLKEKFEQICDRLKLSRSDAIRKAMHMFITAETAIPTTSFTGTILGTITFLESSHLHAHPLPKENLPHEHDGKVHIHPPQPHAHHPDSDSHYFSVEQLEFIEINELQHHYLDVVLSTTHIHAGPEKCMQIIAVNGQANRILELLDRLKHFKTITNIQLFIVEKNPTSD